MDATKPVSINNNIFKCYLIGSMEKPGKNDGGVGWRAILGDELNRRGVYCFDPTKEEKEKIGMSTKDFHNKLTQLLKVGKFSAFKKQMNKIWRGVSLIKGSKKNPRVLHIMGDTDYVEHSDFLVFNYARGDKPGGTIVELVLAWYRGIPVYLVTRIPVTKINKSWLFFVLDSGHGRGEIFKTANQLLEFLEKKYNLTYKK